MTVTINGTAGVVFPNGDQQAGVLGTVSRASGLPTGSIIESGSNADGSYIKFADGTLVQYMNKTETRSASGVNTTSMTFPVEFATTSTVGPRNIANYAAFASVLTSVPQTATSISVNSPTSTSIEVRINRSDATSTVFFLICIGKWF